jgi:hypothetical protein
MLRIDEVEEKVEGVVRLGRRGQSDRDEREGGLVGNNMKRGDYTAGEEFKAAIAAVWPGTLERRTG